VDYDERELDAIIDELPDDTLHDEEAFDEDDPDSDPQDPIDLTIDEFLAREAVLCGPWWPGRGRSSSRPPQALLGLSGPCPTVHPGPPWRVGIGEGHELAAVEFVRTEVAFLAATRAEAAGAH
jgi:hypothetical protein